MVETELKFQVPAAARTAVARAVATPGAERIRLAAVYADTADRRLAAAGLALRLRREGRRWVQTLKGRGDGLVGRPEHEVVVAGARPALDPARHAGTPVGEALLALLADGTPLEEIYRTEIVRHRRVLRSGGAKIELAHDRGHILAGGRTLAVDELEFELKSGPPAVLPALAARWVQRHGLWWDVRTKSERGFRLAEHRDLVPAAKAGPSTLPAGAQGPEALAAMLRDALAQATANGAELAEGLGGPAHLHQLRVGLRRLRSVLRGAAGWAADAESAEAARALERDWAEPFATLGAARDADVLGAGVLPQLAELLAQAGLPPLEPPANAAEAVDPGALWRGAAVQALLLRTLVLALPEPAPEPTQAAQADAGALLTPLWKRVKREARELETLDEEALHRLRKRCKRLRYLLEALAPQLRRKPLARLLRALRTALDRLGELNDLHTARQRLWPSPQPTPSVAFAAGWLVARAAALRPAAQAALQRATALPPPWRSG